MRFFAVLFHAQRRRHAERDSRSARGLHGKIDLISCIAALLDGSGPDRRRILLGRTACAKDRGIAKILNLQAAGVIHINWQNTPTYICACSTGRI